MLGSVENIALCILKLAIHENIENYIIKKMGLGYIPMVIILSINKLAKNSIIKLKRGFKATFFYKNDKIYVKYIFISF